MRVELLPVAALMSAVVALGACQTGPSAPAAAPATKPAGTAQPLSQEAARNLANNCFTCHGPGGQSPGAIPSLTRLSAADIESRLQSFKSGATPSTVMGRHAKGYSDAEIRAVARYIAGLTRSGDAK